MGGEGRPRLRGVVPEVEEALLNTSAMNTTPPKRLHPKRLDPKRLDPKRLHLT